MNIWIIGTGIIVTLLMHLVVVVHYFGKMSGMLQALDHRVERIEALIDRKVFSA